MFSYLLLDIGFILIAASLCCAQLRSLSAKNLIKTVVVVLTLSLIFDQFIIAYDIVNYHENLLTGLFVGKAPVEDFAYSIVAAILMPALWQKAKHAK